MEIIFIFKHALMISFFVFVMMLLVDFIDMATKGRVSAIIKGGRWRQYTLASFLGSTPGCLGAFMNVSLYVHGMISFGAIVGGMIATSGDEAFVMLTQFPGTALALFGLLFVFGILFAWVSDGIIPLTRFTPCESCLDARCDVCLPDIENQEKFSDIFQPANFAENFHSISFTRFLLIMMTVSFMVLIAMGNLGPSTWDWKRVTFICLSLCTLCIIIICSEHYLESHIWDHIIKKHLFRVFLWSFGALLFVHWGLAFWNLDSFVQDHILWVLLIAALMGIIPESGPHLIFVMIYERGLIPFSVLLTVSFVQDGHGMLPLLSYSLKDSMLIKIFNFAFGLTVGGVFFALGF
ncbi:MAG: putative manganese transporter [Thermodesulfobacteriota bacterium]|nr:putative manganese transporter [Thermodesulfobacteriota bacterium]